MDNSTRLAVSNADGYLYKKAMAVRKQNLAVRSYDILR
jgi:hypothetical protein